MQVINCPQLNIKKISHLTMTVCIVSNAIKLKVHITQAGFSRLAAKFFALRKLNTVSCCLYRVITNLT